MLARLSFAIVAAAALGLGPHADASPITYNFAGTFQSPFNGSEQFSGSFTINGDPPASPYGKVSESRGDVALNVNMGGHDYNFVYQPNVVSNPGLFVGPSAAWLDNQQGPEQIAFQLVAETPLPNGSASFSLQFLSNAWADNLANLKDFSFPLNTSSVIASAGEGGVYAASQGSITSIELVTTPEPSTLAAFAALGTAALVRSRRRE